MSQLLCEQVVGRGLRRTTYEVGENGLMNEEIATVLGVPLSAFTVKATKGGNGEKADASPYLRTSPKRGIDDPLSAGGGLPTGCPRPCYL